MAKKNLAVITGASSGIGEIYAKQLAGKYEHLVIAARRLERLEKLKSELDCKVEVCQVDLITEEGRDTLISVTQKIGVPDLLVNNAGFGSLGSFLNREPRREADMIRLNCEALMELSLRFLPAMKERGSGGIINVASIAGYTPMPYMNTYAATKAFVHSFSLSLYSEFKNDGIHVMSHCPGPTPSEFHKVVGLDKKMEHIPSRSAELVVKEAISAYEKRKPVIVNGLANRALTILTKILPGTIAALVVKIVLRKEGKR